MPVELRAALENVSEEDQRQIAEDHMADVVQKLLDGGVPGIHFYCMNRSKPTIRLLEQYPKRLNRTGSISSDKIALHFN